MSLNMKTYPVQELFNQMLPAWDTEASRNQSTGKACDQTVTEVSGIMFL